ncbi:YebC/PmpR family DNA-binding transcriptional regulator [Candidatus Gracilibacteria bacterium]|nr:YebC/PmpR family DNA-binding transcriptional regulator [Candidatus Gracilibacteria bacterium]
MGRWHSIAAKKASGDAAKSRIYSIIGKKIQIAAKNGADPKMNPSLEMVLEKARYHGLPKDVIERAILKGSGQLEGEEMKEVVYEGYGPNGSALLIKTITSNTNRTSQTVRTALQKAGGSMAEIGAVAWQFKEQGVIVIDGILEIVEDKGRQLEKITPFNAEELELQLMELAIEDLSIEDGVAEVTTSKSDFITVRSQISELGYHIAEADIHYIADNQVSLSGEDLEIFEKIVDAINEDEDVDHLYHNVAL